MHRAFIGVAIVVILTAVPEKPPAQPGPSTSCPADTRAFSPATSSELQSALDCATAGAMITLKAGAVYAGNFTLRYKPGYDGTAAMRITIESSGVDSLPERRRVSPSSCRTSPCGNDDRSMASLAIPSGSSAPVLNTELVTLPDGTRRAASGYQLSGLKLSTDHWVAQLVRLGTGTETLVSELPGDLTFDRSYFAGSPGQGAKQGLVG